MNWPKKGTIRSKKHVLNNNKNKNYNKKEFKIQKKTP